LRNRSSVIAAGTAWDTVTAYVNIYRRIIFYPRHWPPACLRSWAEFNFAGRPTVVGGCRRWKYFMWTSSADATYSSKTIRFIFRDKMVETCAIRFAFRANLSTSAIHRRCTGDPLGQIAERCQLRIGRRDMRTRLKRTPMRKTTIETKIKKMKKTHHLKTNTLKRLPTTALTGMTMVTKRSGDLKYVKNK